MRRIRLLIPVTVYLLTLLIVWAVDTGNQRKFKEIYSESMASDRPVVLFYNGAAKYTPLRAFSLDGESANIHIPVPYFISLPTYDVQEQEYLYQGYVINRANNPVWRLSFPECANTIAGWTPVPSSELRETYPQVCLQSLPWMFLSDNENYTYWNYITNEIYTFNSSTDPVLGQIGTSRRMTQCISAAQFYLRANVILIDIGRQIYRYDRNTGEVGPVIQKMTPFMQMSGRGGDIVALNGMGNNSSVSHFVDTRTGTVIKTVNNSKIPYIGERWAAYISTAGNQNIASSRQAVGRDLDIVVMDMEDNWKEYTVDIGLETDGSGLGSFMYVALIESDRDSD